MMTKTLMNRLVGAARVAQMGGRLPVVNARCCSGGRLCDRCAAGSLATLVRNQPPKKGDGIDWAALGELLGVEADPADLAKFVSQLKARLDEIVAELDGGGAAEPEPEEETEMPEGEMPAVASLFGHRRQHHGGQTFVRNVAAARGDREAGTIRNMTMPQIAYGSKGKKKEARQARNAAAPRNASAADAMFQPTGSAEELDW
jgi:hypothetical protein